MINWIRSILGITRNEYFVDTLESDIEELKGELRVVQDQLLETIKALSIVNDLTIDNTKLISGVNNIVERHLELPKVGKTSEKYEL